jgi:hypothetical protein
MAEDFRRSNSNAWVTLVFVAVTGVVVVGAVVLVVDAMIADRNWRVASLEMKLAAVEERSARMQIVFERFGRRLETLEIRLKRPARAVAEEAIDAPKAPSESAPPKIESAPGGKSVERPVAGPAESIKPDAESDGKQETAVRPGPCEGPLLVAAGRPQFLPSLKVDSPLLADMAALLPGYLEQCRGEMKPPQITAVEKAIERMKQLIQEGSGGAPQAG